MNKPQQFHDFRGLQLDVSLYHHPYLSRLRVLLEKVTNQQLRHVLLWMPNEVMKMRDRR